MSESRKATKRARSPLATAAGSLQRRTLTDDVTDAVTALIMDDVLAPGARVNIDAVARSLGVSHTPVREALASLVESGLVRKESLRGFFTTPLLTTSKFAELFEFRRMLEPWAAAQAAERGHGAARQRLRAEMRAGRGCQVGTSYDSYRALTEHDIAFHDLLFAMAGNQLARGAFQRTRTHMHLFRLSFATSIASSSVVEHDVIADAVLAGDGGAAAAAMRAHLEASYARLRGAATQ